MVHSSDTIITLIPTVRVCLLHQLHEDGSEPLSAEKFWFL